MPASAATKERRSKELHQPGCVELMAIDRESLLQLCRVFPKSAALLQARSIEDMRRLSDARQRKEHLHPANFCHFYYRERQINLDRKAAEDLSLEIESLTVDQKDRYTRSTMAKVVKDFDGIMQDIMSRLGTVQQQIKEINLQESRRGRRTQHEEEPPRRCT